MRKITSSKINRCSHCESPVIPSAQVIHCIVGFILKAYRRVTRSLSFVQKLDCRASMPSSAKVYFEIHNLRENGILEGHSQDNLRNTAYYGR
jgi:hypothetical protein